MAATNELYHSQVNSVHISTSYSSRHKLMLLFPIYNKFPKGLQLKFCTYFSSLLYTLHALLTIFLFISPKYYVKRTNTEMPCNHRTYIYTVHIVPNTCSNKIQLHASYTRPSSSPYLDLGRKIIHKFSTLQHKKGDPFNVTWIKKAIYKIWPFESCCASLPLGRPRLRWQGDNKMPSKE